MEEYWSSLGNDEMETRGPDFERRLWGDMNLAVKGADGGWGRSKEGWGKISTPLVEERTSNGQRQEYQRK